MTIRTKEEFESTRKVLNSAERALKALRDDLLPDSIDEYEAFSGAYINQVHKLRYEIDEYLGLVSAEEDAMPLWVRIQGNQITDRAPISVLSNFLKDFRNGIYQIVKYNAKVHARRIPTEAELQRLTDPRIKVMSGSLRIGFALPPPQASLEGVVDDLPIDAMKKMLVGASWATGTNRKALQELLPDRIERYLVLRNVERLSSLKGGKVSLEFRGRLLKGGPLMLTKEAAQKAKVAITEDLPREMISAEGIVREIDLDNKRFQLRLTKGGRRQCNYSPELEDEVKVSLDKKVKVIGTSHPATGGREPPVKVEIIETIDETEE